MPTKQRLQTRADAQRWLSLPEAAARVGYSAEYLRRMAAGSARRMGAQTRPPMEKYRGKWRVRADKLDAWAADSDDAVAS